MENLVTFILGKNRLIKRLGNCPFQIIQYGGEAMFYKLNTLGAKKKEFEWNYNENTILIKKPSYNNLIKYSDSELDKIIKYIKDNDRVSLANNVEKLKKGLEKDGLGKFVFNNIESEITKAQSVSQIVAILHKVGALYYNNAKKNMEFWVSEKDWKRCVKEYIKQQNNKQLEA